MASLRRKPRSPFYYACFYLPAGARTQRSTRIRAGAKGTEKKAQQLADKWEDAARSRITEGQARRVLSEIHELVHGTPLGSATLSDYFEQWIARKTGEVAPVSLAAYRSAGQDFVVFMGEKASQQIHYITTPHIARYRDHIAAATTPRTANNKLKIVRTLFQSAWRDGLLSENPAAKVQTLRAADSLRRPFTLPELRTLLANASTDWRGMILTGLYTGQRLKDVASLTWASVDLARAEIRLATSKTGRRQIIPIAAPLRAHFEAMPSSDNPTEPLFPAAYLVATQRRDTSPLSQGFHDLLVDAGLAGTRPSKAEAHGAGRSAKRHTSAITFHSLRHTATSLLKNAGVSEVVAMDIIGHESALISRHYTHVDEDTKRAALAMLPDVTA